MTTIRSFFYFFIFFALSGCTVNAHVSAKIQAENVKLGLGRENVKIVTPPDSYAVISLWRVKAKKKGDPPKLDGLLTITTGSPLLETKTQERSFPLESEDLPWGVLYWKRMGDDAVATLIKQDDSTSVMFFCQGLPTAATPYSCGTKPKDPPGTS